MPSIKCLENQANGLSRYKQQSDLTDPADDFLFAAVFQGKLERLQSYSAIMLPFHLVPDNNVWLFEFLLSQFKLFNSCRHQGEVLLVCGHETRINSHQQNELENYSRLYSITIPL